MTWNVVIWNGETGKSFACAIGTVNQTGSTETNGVTTTVISSAYEVAGISNDNEPLDDPLDLSKRIANASGTENSILTSIAGILPSSHLPGQAISTSTRILMWNTAFHQHAPSHGHIVHMALHIRRGRAWNDLLPWLHSHRHVQDTSKHIVNHHTVLFVPFPSPARRRTFRRDKEGRLLAFRLS